MRIVAFTRDPSLGAALNMLEDWEVTAARDVDEVADSARGAVALLIGLGDTDEGVDAANQLMARGVTIPAIVVGEQPPSGSQDIPVLIRPFSLDDLRNALDLASKEGARRGQRSADDDERTPIEPPVSEDQQAGSASDSAKNAEHAEAEGERDAMVLKLHPQRLVEAPGPPPTPKPAQASAEPAAAISAEPTTAPVAAPRPEGPQRQGLPPLPTEAVKERLGRGGRGRLARHRRGHQDQPADDDTSPIVRELRLAAVGARAIERLVDELPMLSDLQAMANALMGEVIETFRPETASLMLKRVEGFVPISSSRLSRTEQHMVVPDDHPLIAKLLETNEPILIAPVDLALGLVAGIGGARTEALIAAPLLVDNHCIAVLIIGRHGFDDAELDTLDVLAREAAPGLAVAQLLQRLRSRR